MVDGGAAPETIHLHECLIVVGNEAHGIPKEWLETCEQQTTISMPGKTESLNASVAGSIALYLAYSPKKTE